MNIPNYIERFYTAAQEKGFYDESWNITTEKALIITEICEAIQADRKDRRANVAHFKERFATGLTWEEASLNGLPLPLKMA